MYLRFHEVPGPPADQLSDRDRQRLGRAMAKIEAREEALRQVELEAAALIRRLGVSASARELGWSRQRLDSKLKTIEARAKRAEL